jgi:tetratricopeptide (TPR) repeat protein
MKFRNLVVAAAGALLLALTSFAQITAIEGDVKGEDGAPLVKALVKITRTDIKGNYKCNTDKKGHYFYNGLPLGMYNVAVEVDGKEMDGQNGVRTRLGDPVPVNFDLQKIAKERGAKNAQMNQAAAAMAAGGTAPALSKEQERGMTKEQKEAFDKAIKERETSMKKNKELNDAFTAGLAEMQSGAAAKDPAERAKHYEAAIPSLTKASELDPKQVAVWAQLADAHVNVATTKTGAEFDAEMAKGIEGYTKALELNPADAATHNNFALALGKAKKFPEMQAELQKAAELDPPKAGQYYYNLGAMLVNAGQSEPAALAFKKAIELDPNHADSYYQMGIYLLGKASFGADGKVTPVAGTVEAFQKYLQLAPAGQFAQSAKDMLTSLDAKVDTAYKNPNAPAPKKKK